MEKEFLTYEQAIALKELGFDEPCFGYYNTTWSKQNELLFPQYAGELENWNKMTHLCSAPLRQQAFHWFREKHNFVSWVYEDNNTYIYTIVKNGRFDDFVKAYSTYEEAEAACINSLIELAK